MLAISILTIIVVIALKLNGVLVTINGTVADSFPNTIEKQISAQYNNSILIKEIE